jgi:hypothetical protein
LGYFSFLLPRLFQPPRFEKQLCCCRLTLRKRIAERVARQSAARVLPFGRNDGKRDLAYRCHVPYPPPRRTQYKNLGVWYFNHVLLTKYLEKVGTRCALTLIEGVDTSYTKLTKLCHPSPWHVFPQKRILMPLCVMMV